MKKNPVLVVMAAGMGSRYGGLKQIDPVGCCGEAILDFSLYDAHEAGFQKAVIIIKEAIKKDFMDTVGKRLEKCPMEIVYAYQEIDMLPEGFTVPDGRSKPWGTSHCILCAAEAIGDAPFAVLNADDYYGKSAFREIYNYLYENQDNPNGYCMVGYRLDKTVTDHGTVSRGVCCVNEQGYLTGIVERTKIEKYEGGTRFTEDDGATWTDLPTDTPVSMNMWGFQPEFIQLLKERFPNFLSTAAVKNPIKAEWLLPGTVQELLSDGIVTVKVLSSADKWYGVTYAADKPAVVEALAALTAEGKYPNGLWK